MSEIHGIYVVDSSNPKPGDTERLMDAVRNLDTDAIQATGKRLIEQIDNAVSLQMANAELRRCQVIIGYLVGRLGGKVFIRRSEQESLIIDAMKPGFVPPFKVEEAEDSPINGVYITANRD